MVKQIILPNPHNTPLQVLYKKELLRLRESGTLAQRLAELDQRQPLRRIYVMGCGRSGTWLLMHIMNTFLGVEVVLRESAIEYFGLMTTENPVLVLKRDHVAYQRIDQPHPTLTQAATTRNNNCLMPMRKAPCFRI